MRQTTLASTNSAVCSDTVPVPWERSGETLPTEDVARLFGNIWRLISESLPLPACTTRARPLIPIGGTDHYSDITCSVRWKQNSDQNRVCDGSVVYRGGAGKKTSWANFIR